MSADRACASVLPLLLGKLLDEASRSRVHQVFVIALTHANNEVRWYAASGIGGHLWAVDRDLTRRCVNGLATEATLVQQGADANVRRPYPERREIDHIAAEAASVIRGCFFSRDGIAGDAYQTCDTSGWFGAEANRCILAILGQAPTEPAAIAAFERLAHTLVGWWNADDNRHRNQDERRRERNHETESALSQLFQRFLLRTSGAAATAILQPILDAVDGHPREVSRLLEGLIGFEDREPNTPSSGPFGSYSRTGFDVRDGLRESIANPGAGAR